MTQLLCGRCFLMISVIGDPREVERLIIKHPRWRGGHTCVRCGGPMALTNGPLPDHYMRELVTHVEVSVEDCFRAMCGFGLPEEVQVEPEVVLALLLSTKVTNASVSRSEYGRTILDRLDLDNGLSLHLCSSSMGPAVFKITRKSDERTTADVGDDQRTLREDPKDPCVHGGGHTQQRLHGGGEVGARGTSTPGGVHVACGDE